MDLKVPYFNKVLFRFFPKLKFVNTGWLIQLKLQNTFSRKIKVGLGHINTGEQTLGNRKWHIDPIVKYINEHDNRYVCDIFVPGEDLSKFDIAVMVKRIKYVSKEDLDRYKKHNTLMVFNVSDNPAGCDIDYEASHWFIKAMDCVIMLNPLQGINIEKYASRLKLMSPPIIDPRYKQSYEENEPIRIFWDGYANNMYTMERLNGIIRKLSGVTTKKIEMVYNSNIPERTDGIIKYTRWSIDNWKDRILKSDIGVVIKPMGDERQQKKPPTKIISYMSSGLPVVCTPSEADKRVIKHGETGFFAYSDEEWYQYLKELVEDRELRERIGIAGREYAVEHFNIKRIAEDYMNLFDELIENRLC